jgi:hypothetical protein
MFKKFLRIVVAIVVANAICQAQQEAATTPHIGAGIKLSLLGIGGEAAIPITNKIDIRGGFNALSYSRTSIKMEWPTPGSSASVT